MWERVVPIKIKKQSTRCNSGPGSISSAPGQRPVQLTLVERIVECGGFVQFVSVSAGWDSNQKSKFV